MLSYQSVPPPSYAAVVLQGLKVKFSGVKAPAAKDFGGNAQLDKDEQKKQAKLRKAQKALGL